MQFRLPFPRLALKQFISTNKLWDIIPASHPGSHLCRIFIQRHVPHIALPKTWPGDAQTKSTDPSKLREPTVGLQGLPCFEYLQACMQSYIISNICTFSTLWPKWRIGMDLSQGSGDQVTHATTKWYLESSSRPTSCIIKGGGQGQCFSGFNTDSPGRIKPLKWKSSQTSHTEVCVQIQSFNPVNQNDSSNDYFSILPSVANIKLAKRN